MRRRKTSLVVIFLLALSTFSVVTVLLTTDVEATTLFVGGTGPGNHTTIQSALNAANPGDDVYVYSGTYYENTVIDKPLSLIGEDRDNTIIDGGGNGDVILITAHWVNVTGLTITNGTGWANDGIVLDDVRYCTIANNVVMNNRRGILLHSYSRYNRVLDNIAISNENLGIDLVFSTNNILSGNVMIGNGIRMLAHDVEDLTSHVIDTSNTVNGKPVYYWKNVSGSVVPPGAGQIILANCTDTVIENQDVSDGSIGITLGFSTNVTIRHNDVSSNRNSGIYLFESHGNLVGNNTVSHVKSSGIYLWESTWNQIRNNTVSDNNHGIYMRESNFNTIANNVITQSVENGIDFWDCDNNTLDDNEISGNNYGIYFDNLRWNRITNNTIYENNDGIHLFEARSNIFADNDISRNDNSGIYMRNSYGNEIFRNNIFSNGDQGLRLMSANSNYITNNSIYWNPNAGINIMYSSGERIFDNEFLGAGISLNYGSIWDWNSHRMDDSNTLNGKPILYWKDVNGGSIPSGYSQIILANCTGIVIENLNLSDGPIAINIGYSSANRIASNTISNISVNNTNTLSSLYRKGIHLWRSHNHTITNNTVTKTGHGIDLGSYSRDNTISENYLRDNWRSLELDFSDWNTIENNTIEYNEQGIWVWISDNNTIRGNTFYRNSAFGTDLYHSYNTNVYHNNFVENTRQAMDDRDANRWDDGYPSGGNYWSDYTGVDMCSGPNQDICPDPDWMGDSPYPLNMLSMDNYPLMKAFGGDVFPPMVTIEAPGNGEIVGTNPTEVTGTASDSGGSGLQLVEVRINNGSWVSASGLSSWSAFLMMIIGPNYIEARAYDNTGQLSETEWIVVIYNTPPVASFTVTPTSGNLTTTFVLDASSSSDSEDPLSALEVRWDFQDDGVWDTPWLTTKTFHPQYGLPSNYTIRLEVRDTTGLTDDAIGYIDILDVTENLPPVCAILAPSSGETLSNTTVISGSASDSDGSVERVEVSIDGDAWIQVAGTDSWTYSWDTATVSNGPHTIYARSYDGENFSNVMELPVVVSNADQPTQDTDDTTIWILVMVIIIIVVLVPILLFFVLMKRKKQKDADVPEPPPPEEPL